MQGGEVMNYIYLAVSRGHRKLAADLLKDVMKCNEGLFNFLHYSVLAFDGKEDLKPFREVSVRKKPWNNHRVCSNINLVCFIHIFVIQNQLLL